MNMTRTINVMRILTAAKGIEKHSAALDWLENHGAALQQDGKDSFSIGVRIHVASALPGSKEAEDELSAIARLFIREIVASAIKDCVNTIAIYKQTLRDEAAQ